MRINLPLAVCLLFAACIVFEACKKNDPAPAQPAPKLTINKTTLTVPMAGRKDTIVITADVSWNISIPADASTWISVDKVSGTPGTNTVLITTSQSKLISMRSGKLTITSQTDGVDPLTLTVNQPHELSIWLPIQSAKGGDTIDIAGLGFSTVPGENFVTINGKQVEVVKATASLLSVVVPSKAGSGDLVVKVGTETASVQFDYGWVGKIAVIAGGQEGYADGIGANAMFRHPAGLGIDASDNIYVADYANSKVRKITPAGQVTTLPGRIPALSDPSGPNTDFGIPSDITIDGLGNIYIAETNSNSISKITPDGTVSLFAGGNGSAYADGTGTAASFYWPTGIAVDGSNNIYVAEISNHRIRKITPEAVVTTIAGSTQGYGEGTGTAALFNMPYSLILNKANEILVTDYYNNRIRKISTGGVVSTFAKDDGNHYYLYRPLDIAIGKDGVIYTADSNNNLYFIGSDGIINAVRTFKDMLGNPFQINSPAGITLNTANEIFVSDYYGNRICKVSLE